MQTTINSVDVTWTGVGAKKYGKAIVKHDAGQGERTQTLVSFKNPEVFKKVQELVGKVADVEMTKDGQFWQWVKIDTVESAGNVARTASTATASATRVSGSNYETKDERAARQVLIVKQSSLSSAVATLSPGAKTAVDPNAVIELAQKYTDWVFETHTNDVETQPGGIDVFN